MLDLDDLLQQIQLWAKELGFQQIGITQANVDEEADKFNDWLESGYHGDMGWMEQHKHKRLDPASLHPHATHVISARMNYLPGDTQMIETLKTPEKAYVSRYALGRDYHKLFRKKLAQLEKKIAKYCEQTEPDLELSQRPFVDSAPVLERPLAQQAGLGWVGKHTLLINESAGSWFFLGEIYTNLRLPTSDTQTENKCGDCQACLQVCPTQAFPKPYLLDARRCISYLTIENKGPIPEEFREVMGNRVFGCDDCQAICPWNKYAQFSDEQDFQPRHKLDQASLLELFRWDEETFLKNTEGSPIRRIGYEGWLRNLSIGIGNAPQDTDTISLLEKRLAEHQDHWLAEHFEWALNRQQNPPKRKKRKLKT